MFLVLWASALPSHCQEILDQATENGQKWRVKADSIKYDSNTSNYTASGNVEIVRDQMRLTADHVMLDRKDMTATATGSVTLVSEGDRMSGSSLELDLEKETGTLFEGRVFTTENNFRIRGSRIEKTGENTYHITEGSLTSCEGLYPDWQITGKQVDVTIEGYGYATHAAFWAKRLPMIYVPWFMFPVKLQRQTGLLMPQAGYSSRKGAEYAQPFFWAISDNSDATFYYHHMQKRGEKLGVEYRYMLSENSKGTLLADGFRDSKVDDGSEDATDDWGYDDDNVLRPNDDRYWIRMKADQELFRDTTGHLDLDIVSDQDYLREFSDGYMGHESTDDYFGSEFGRDIDDENDPVRTNRLNINRTWSYQSVNADLVWYDNVIKRRLKDKDDTLQQMPRVQYSALKQPVLDDITPDLLFGSLDSGYTYFYRRDEPADTSKGHTGHRLDMHPRVYLPLRAGRFISFEPSFGFRHTAWYIDADRDFHGQGRDRYLHRELFDIEADLTTDINRVFSVDTGRVEKIKHVVIPRLNYGFIPETDQSEFPKFDQTDRIDAQNRISLSFTHLFTSKASKPGNKGDNSNGYTYNRFARFFIEQAYDFRQKGDPDSAWMPLFAELDLTPSDLVTLSADGTWNHANNELDTGNLSLRLYDQRGDELKAEYRYTRREDRDSIKTVNLYAKTPVTKNLTLFGNYERNLETETDIEKGLGVRYQSQCWAVELAWLDEEDDTQYMAMVELTGLGEFGNTLDER